MFANTPGLIGRKHVDATMFTDGNTTIPASFQPHFEQANGTPLPGPNERREVILLIEEKEYRAQLINQDRSDVKSDRLKLDYASNKEFRDLLRQRLQHSYTYLQENKWAEKNSTRVKVPDEHAEYLDFYATGRPYCYRVEIIPYKPTAALIDVPRIVPITKLDAIAKEFGDALGKVGIRFGARHDEQVRTFVASLAAKRFLILAGLSGSGKTQIALRFGQWFGPERWRLLPVRPDWNGPEPLLGYPDALQSAQAGENLWHVPEALAFMLRAVEQPDDPHLLILDEMNLAHVERYFADVLSGMESGAPCLPNLVADGHGRWRLRSGGPERIPWPANLFVVGTVNVDETTYMFSAKVLDRANTLEFRVAAEDLELNMVRPGALAQGNLAYVRGFLQVAQDEGFHRKQAPAWQGELVDALKALHRLLDAEDFAFGHRLFYEAIRFGAMYQAAGRDDQDEVLDLILLQKLLPRLHGSRRRLEPLLASLGAYCADVRSDGGKGAAFDPLTYRETPRLPRSFQKIRQMMRLVRANQFASFMG